MMLYQQTMFTSTIEPISSHRSSFIERRKTSGSQEQKQQQPQKPQQQRSVNFSSCTKKETDFTNNNGQQEKQAGVKRRTSSSSNVPIPACMFRSPSELQLTVDEQVADERDFAFFARVVSGISERRSSSTTNNITQTDKSDGFIRYIEETDRCLTHIIQTRHHHDQQEQQDGILIEDDSSNQVGGGVYYLGEDLDCFTSSSSSSSSSGSSILYQHEFDEDEDEHKHNHNDDLYNEGDCECMFDLEL